MGDLPHLPVTSHLGATLNFETLERQVSELQEQGKRHVGGGVGAWTNPESFSTKTEEHATLQVRSEATQNVGRLKGHLKAKEAIPPATVLFTLPVGLRPAASVKVWAADATSNTVIYATIETSGTVLLATEVTIAHLVFFDGITFNLT